MNLTMESRKLKLRSRGFELATDDSAFGWLRDSSSVRDDTAALRARLAEDGYLFLPGFHRREEVWRAREVVTQRLREDGFTDPTHPHDEAVVAPGLKVVNEKSAFRPPVENDGAPAAVKVYNADRLTKHNAPLEQVLFGRARTELFERLLGGPVRHFTYTWFRMVSPGLGTPPHCDIVYMGRGTPRVLTAWTPLGDIPLAVGGLMILEHSIRHTDRLARYLSRDVDEYCVNGPHADEIRRGEKLYEWDGTLSKNPVTLREKLGGRWLTAEEYRAGDVLIFTMHTVHASLDNQSDRLRLSCDNRCQLLAEPADERFIVENPVPYSPDFKRGRIC